MEYLMVTLGEISNRDGSGKHFTEAFPAWRDLERAGYLEVHRPVHADTGIQYSREYWTLDVTPEGLDAYELWEQSR